MDKHQDYLSSSLLNEEDQHSQSEHSSSTSPIEALKQLASSDYAIETASTTKFIADTLGVDSDVSHSLEQRIKAFQKKQNDLVTDYTHAASKCAYTPDNCLCVLDGWQQESLQDTSLSSLAGNLLTRSNKKTSGGFFLRWNGTGIAINPGAYFLVNFHKQGFHIRDIDYVIITRDTPESYADVEAIYELNYQLNKQSGGELHIISYFLNQQAHRYLSAYLKPNFKQERNTVHSLELFLDSSEVEKVDLCPDLTLHFFQSLSHTESSRPSSLEERTVPACPSLSIRLDCKTLDNRTLASIGYLSGVAWSPLLAHNLGHCDVLITGFDNTHPSDYNKVQYNEDGLGYFGTYSLLEEVAPRLLLCCEYGGREGDIRLEVTKKMRQEYAYSHHQTTVILPGDIGLYLDLKALQVRCSVTHRLVEPSEVRLVRTSEAFGRLQYLSPSCFC